MRLFDLLWRLLGSRPAWARGRLAYLVLQSVVDEARPPSRRSH